MERKRERACPTCLLQGYLWPVGYPKRRVENAAAWSGFKLTIFFSFGVGASSSQGPQPSPPSPQLPAPSPQAPLLPTIPQSLGIALSPGPQSVCCSIQIPLLGNYWRTCFSRSQGPWLYLQGDLRHSTRWASPFHTRLAWWGGAQYSASGRWGVYGVCHPLPRSRFHPRPRPCSCSCISHCWRCWRCGGRENGWGMHGRGIGRSTRWNSNVNFTHPLQQSSS